MLKTFFMLLIFTSVGIAQSASDGSFSVQNLKRANFSLSVAQMRQAESLYRSACAVVQHDFRGGEYHEKCPHFTLVIGTDRNEVRNIGQMNDAQGDPEIRMKKWNPILFAQGVVILSFDKILTSDVVTQLSKRAIRYSNTTVDVDELK